MQNRKSRTIGGKVAQPICNENGDRRRKVCYNQSMKLTELKGVGEKTLKKLEMLGITDERTLLDFLPKSYWDMTKEGDLSAAEHGEYVLLKGELVRLTKVAKVRSGLNFFRAEIFTQDVNVRLVWFNAPYLRANLREGERYTVWGKVSKKDGRTEIVNPGFEPEGGDRLSGVVPIYATRGLVQQSVMRKITADAVEKCRVEPLLEDDDLMPLYDAYRYAHVPLDKRTAYIARRRLALEELTARLCAYRLAKAGESGRKERSYPLDFDSMDDLVESLPYKLSDSQISAIRNIMDDLKSPRRMNRMLLGDVGCGKTIVALVTMAYAARCGYQSALMAPTEILARQHYENAVKLLSPFGISCAFLAGSLSAKEKKSIYNDIKERRVDVVIGTHAVISDKVEFSSLGYIVIDELHKFGVRQKSLLENKACSVDVAIMSATPIPRVLALGEYGDVDVSAIESRKTLDEYPKTFVVRAEKEKGMFEFVRQRVLEGEQAYIVCPLVEDSEGLEVSSAKSVYEDLKDGVFEGLSVGLVYGSMRDEAKEKVMNAFYSGEYSVLVATSVVEVGIDSKNATVMCVMDADRFGLASLHQLRGRVGRRSGMTSYCFLHTLKDDECERLKILCDHFDGFAIAEEDARIRGYGDFLGFRQSGGVGGALIDKKLLERSRRYLDKLFEPQNIDKLKNPRIKEFLNKAKNISMT